MAGMELPRHDAYGVHPRPGAWKPMLDDHANRSLINQIAKSIASNNPNVEMDAEINSEGAIHINVHPIGCACSGPACRKEKSTAMEAQAVNGTTEAADPPPPDPRAKWLMLSATEESLFAACTPDWQSSTAILKASGYEGGVMAGKVLLTNLAERGILEVKRGSDGGYRLMPG